MKKLTVLLALAAALSLTACGADRKEINGITYDTYGLINKDEKKNSKIEYEVSTWAVVWAVVFSETIIVPVFIIGWDLYQPVGVKDPNAVPGQVGPAQK